jgi:predicted Zn-dependent protease
MAANLIGNLEKLLGTPRDGALLRYSLGSEYLKAGERERGIDQLREAVSRDPQYSAAWKALGRALADAGRDGEACAAYDSGIRAARARGDRQAEKEMAVFARRLERRRGA